MSIAGVAGLSQALAGLGSTTGEQGVSVARSGTPPVATGGTTGTNQTTDNTNATTTKPPTSVAISVSSATVGSSFGSTTTTTFTTYSNGSTQSVVHDAEGQLVSVTTTPPSPPTNGTAGDPGLIVDAQA